MWNQHVRYDQDERELDEPYVHALFLVDLCNTLSNFRDLNHHVVLCLDANNDVRDGEVSAALAEIGIAETVIKNHKGESAPDTCSRNTSRKPIDSI